MNPWIMNQFLGSWIFFYIFLVNGILIHYPSKETNTCTQTMPSLYDTGPPNPFDSLDPCTFRQAFVWRVRFGIDAAMPMENFRPKQLKCSDRAESSQWWQLQYHEIGLFGDIDSIQFPEFLVTSGWGRKRSTQVRQPKPPPRHSLQVFESPTIVIYVGFLRAHP